MALPKNDIIERTKTNAREDYMNGQFMCSYQPSAPHRNMANLVVIQRHHWLNKTINPLSKSSPRIRLYVLLGEIILEILLFADIIGTPKNIFDREGSTGFLGQKTSPERSFPRKTTVSFAFWHHWHLFFSTARKIPFGLILLVGYHEICYHEVPMFPMFSTFPLFPKWFFLLEFLIRTHKHSSFTRHHPGIHRLHILATKIDPKHLRRWQHCWWADQNLCSRPDSSHNHRPGSRSVSADGESRMGTFELVVSTNPFEKTCISQIRSFPEKDRGEIEQNVWVATCHHLEAISWVVKYIPIPSIGMVYLPTWIWLIFELPPASFEQSSLNFIRTLRSGALAAGYIVIRSLLS